MNQEDQIGSNVLAMKVGSTQGQVIDALIENGLNGTNDGFKG